MRPRYLGPVIVLGRNLGGSYLLCELDGTVFDRPTAAFRVIPYFARHDIPLPENFTDATPERIREMMKSRSLGDDDEDSDNEDNDTDINPEPDDIAPESDSDHSE